MLRITLHLCAIDFRHKLKNGKIFLMLALLVGFYAVFVGLNMHTYQAIDAALLVDPIDGKFIRVPLSEPQMNFEYAENFIPFSMSKPTDTEVGLIFYPDRYQDINALTPMAALFFFFTALIIVIFAHNEFAQMKVRGVLQQLLLSHVRKKDLLRAKVLLGSAFLGLVWVLNTLTFYVLAWLKDIELATYQYKQIVLFNFLHSAVLMIFYTLALAFSLRVQRSTKRVLIKDSAHSLWACILMLIVVFFVIPNVVQGLRNFVYDNLAWNFPTEWYWYSHYLQIGDPVTTFGDLTSDILFMERARATYTSIPWTHHLVSTSEFSIYRLFWINWASILTLGGWFIGAYLFAGRRLERIDVV